jgi:hypothetical protein
LLIRLEITDLMRPKGSFNQYLRRCVWITAYMRATDSDKEGDDDNPKCGHCVFSKWHNTFSLKDEHTPEKIRVQKRMASRFQDAEVGGHIHAIKERSARCRGQRALQDLER